MVSDETGLADLQGPAGNIYDKYRTRNPAARLLVARFLREVEACVRAAQPRSVLDVGCGEGIVTERIARVLPGAAIVGLDVGHRDLVAAWQARRAKNLSFRTGSAYALPFGDGSFDVVCALEVLEHLERPNDALAEMARVGAKTLVLSVPREPLWRAANVLSGRYVLALGNTPGHVRHWSRRGFRDFAARAGEVVGVRSPFPWTIAVIKLSR